ncbi:MAG: hypothetical protein JRJ73_04050 [Deltaproteobacteria bacterium]|nr:hypothetical protein [Deltaproteobacteria bacterium]
MGRTLLPWHHVHITLPDREAAAIWYASHTPAERGQPTKRSENLFCGPNLLQIQINAVANEPRGARIDSIGIGVPDREAALADWQSGGGSVIVRTATTARLNDPWGTPFELVETAQAGFTHLLAWYEVNLGGERTVCEWDSSRLALAYDTIQIVFAKTKPEAAATAGRPIDHLGWYTKGLDAWSGTTRVRRRFLRYLVRVA